MAQATPTPTTTSTLLLFFFSSPFRQQPKTPLQYSGGIPGAHSALPQCGQRIVQLSLPLRQRRVTKFAVTQPTQ